MDRLQTWVVNSYKEENRIGKEKQASGGSVARGTFLTANGCEVCGLSDRSFVKLNEN